jgi:hypothetical protein
MNEEEEKMNRCSACGEPIGYDYPDHDHCD